MITSVYTRPTPLNQVISKSSKEIFTLLLNRQSASAQMNFNHNQKPYLHDVLSPSIFDITETADSVQILINYPATIRFLDLKRANNGKKKRYYTPIYNRPLYGHIYGSGYSLSNVINSVLLREYDNYFTNLKNALTVI